MISFFSIYLCRTSILHMCWIQCPPSIDHILFKSSNRRFFQLLSLPEYIISYYQMSYSLIYPFPKPVPYWLLSVHLMKNLFFFKSIRFSDPFSSIKCQKLRFQLSRSESRHRFSFVQCTMECLWTVHCVPQQGFDNNLICYL